MTFGSVIEEIAHIDETLCIKNKIRFILLRIETFNSFCDGRYLKLKHSGNFTFNFFNNYNVIELYCLRTN